MSNVINKRRLEAELIRLNKYFNGYTGAEILLICTQYVHLTSARIIRKGMGELK